MIDYNNRPNMIDYNNRPKMNDYKVSYELPVTEETQKSALNTQIGGDHYKTAKIQPVEYSEANELLFLEGCVVKRVTRHNKPTGKGRQDIEKAIHELQLLLELRYPEIKI